jgi:streptogramin lyase
MKKDSSNLNVKIILIVIATIAVFLISLGNLWQNTDSKNIINTLEPYVKEYSLQGGSKPNALLVDTKGLVWITTSDPKSLLSLDPKNGIINNLRIGNSSNPEAIKENSTMVWTMVQDRDGKIWFASLGTEEIWSLEPENHAFHLFHSETGAPFQMKTGKTGEIWFTTLRGNTIDVIKKSIKDDDYKISSFNTGNNTTPAGIFLQNDTVWTANIDSQKISQYKIDRENYSVKNLILVKNIPRNETTLFSSPTDLLVNNKSIWITEHNTSFLTRYDLNTGKITRYPTSQNNFHTVTLPFWIRGYENPQVLWFNEHQGNKIGRFDLGNDTLTEYTIPSLPKNGYLTYPLNISQDPLDENILWFSEWNTDKVGVINGHAVIPFKMLLGKKYIALSLNKVNATLDLEIQGDMYNSNPVFLNASSSIESNAELGNLTVKFTPSVIDISHKNNTVLMYIHDGGIAPGNYTIGISASNGYVTQTEFLYLNISKK